MRQWNYVLNGFIRLRARTLPDNPTRDLLAEINRDLGVTILLATHALETASITKRTVRMRDGQLAAEAAG